DVHTWSLALAAERRWIEARASGFATWTRFRSSAPSRWTPGAFAGLRIPLGRWKLGGFGAYRKESFESGAPGAYGSGLFEARSGGAELLAKLGEFEARAAWSYEGRRPSGYLRQYEL